MNTKIDKEGFMCKKCKIIGIISIVSVICSAIVAILYKHGKDLNNYKCGCDQNDFDCDECDCCEF